MLEASSKQLKVNRYEFKEQLDIIREKNIKYLKEKEEEEKREKERKEQEEMEKLNRSNTSGRKGGAIKDNNLVGSLEDHEEDEMDDFVREIDNKIRILMNDWAPRIEHSETRLDSVEGTIKGKIVDLERDIKESQKLRKRDKADHDSEFKNI